MENLEGCGYEIGKWYMVDLKGMHDVPGKGIGYYYQIPAKFIGLARCEASRRNSFVHDFPHPGQAVFENVEIEGCGYEGINWVKENSLWGSGKYTGFRPTFRPVTETELWAVRAIERFQQLIAGRHQTFKITLPNGFVFKGQVKPPAKKDNISGCYSATLINPKTGKEKTGTFEYDGKGESPQAFLLTKMPGWQIVRLELVKPRIGTMHSPK
jgi:hypothetical protein